VAGPVAPQNTGTVVTFTAQGLGGTGSYEYMFRLKSGKSWTTVQNFSSSNTWVWNTKGIKATIYTIQVYVRTAGTFSTYDAQTSVTYKLLAPSKTTGATLTVTSTTSNTTINTSTSAVMDVSMFSVGDDLKFKVQGEGGIQRYEYQFERKSGKSWVVVQSYSDADSWTWNTANLASGKYSARVKVRSYGTNRKVDVTKSAVLNLAQNQR
jgi:hypothetical protein